MSVITISRLYGSGGSEVAALVAQRMGWQLLDNDLVDSVAQRLGVSSEEVAAREERVPTLVQRLADALMLAAPEAMPPAVTAPLPPSEERIVEVTTRIIREAIAQGHAVVVGRGAQSILRERADALHVFCHAPREALIARTAERLNMPAGDAAKLVEETNRHREQYVRSHWQRDWRSLDSYHLALNTALLGLDLTADLIVQLAHARFGSGGAQSARISG